MELISRRADPNDHRAYLLSITPLGIETVHNIARTIEQDASFMAWFGDLPVADREKLASLLGNFHTFLNRNFLPVQRSSRHTADRSAT